MQERLYKTDEVIIVAGERGDEAFLIESGSVEVFLRQDGEDVVLAELGPGEIFGEMSLIDPGPRSASVRAISATLCLSTTFEALNSSFHERPDLSMEFMKTLVRRLRSANQVVMSAQPQKQLLRSVAHEFGNVLQGIIGTAELAVNRGDEEADLWEEDLSLILTEAQRGAELTRKLLLEARNQEEYLESVDLCDLLGDVLRSARALLPENIDLSYDLLEDRAQVKVNPAHFKGAVINAVINARDALTRGGEIKICMSCSQLGDNECEPLGLRPGHYAILGIEDNGDGIPEALQKDVFKPFMTTKPPGKGTGLGMGIIRNFVEQSGGAVTVNSIEGLGTSVRLFLPRR